MNGLFFEGTMDGRGAVIVLRAHFEGMEQVDSKVFVAKNMISIGPIDMSYHNDYASLFKKCLAKLRQACTILD